MHRPNPHSADGCATRQGTARPRSAQASSTLRMVNRSLRGTVREPSSPRQRSARRSCCKYPAIGPAASSEVQIRWRTTCRRSEEPARPSRPAACCVQGCATLKSSWRAHRWMGKAGGWPPSYFLSERAMTCSRRRPGLREEADPAQPSRTSSGTCAALVDKSANLADSFRRLRRGLQTAGPRLAAVGANKSPRQAAYPEILD